MKRNVLALIIVCLSATLSCSQEELSIVVERDNQTCLPEELKPYADSFRRSYESCDGKEAFLFFSDPHLLNTNGEFNQADQHRIKTFFAPLKALYDELPLSFCLCGGDWLNNGDTQSAAMLKLLYIDGQMKNCFSHYYKMMGNHDTNYQGVVSSDDLSRGDLPYSFINDDYFSDFGRAYYSFKGENTVFFILDSGLDWETQMDSYRWEQIVWLAEQLLRNKEEHIVIGFHMFFNGKVANNNPMPFSNEVVSLCSAFNKRGRYKNGDRDFSFSDAFGKVHIILAGHNHIDFVKEFNGIPCVGIAKLIKDGVPTYDLCLVNYDLCTIQMFRVGSGNNRTVILAN